MQLQRAECVERGIYRNIIREGTKKSEKSPSGLEQIGQNSIKITGGHNNGKNRRRKSRDKEGPDA